MAILYSLFSVLGNFSLSLSLSLSLSPPPSYSLWILPSELESNIARIAHDVNFIAGYATDNGLKLDLIKSMVLILDSNAFVSRIGYITMSLISVAGSILPYVDKVRNLSRSVCLYKGSFFTDQNFIRVLCTEY